MVMLTAASSPYRQTTSVSDTMALWIHLRVGRV
jgi:hypothetical protein